MFIVEQSTLKAILAIERTVNMYMSGREKVLGPILSFIKLLKTAKKSKFIYIRFLLFSIQEYKQQMSN